MQLKVCFISPKAYPIFNPKVIQTFGGAEVQLYLLAIELAKHKGYEVSFIVGDYGQSPKEDFGGIHVYKSIDQQTGIVNQGLTFLGVFNNIDADVYIHRTITPFSGLLALYCRKRGKGFVYMVSSDPEVLGTHRVYQHPMYRLFINLLWKFSNQIVAQSQFQQTKLAELGISSQVISSSYPIPNLRSMDTSNKDYHLWVGRSAQVKQPEIFIELAKRIPSQKFIMVCPQATNTSDSDYQKLIKLVSSIPNLRFESFVPFNDIDRYYHRAKTLINTSTYEGFPNTFIQAAISKTPIMSLSIDPDGFLEGHQCGIVCNGNFELLVTKLHELVEDDERYNKLSENIYQYALENHAIDKNFHKFISIIESIS